MKIMSKTAKVGIGLFIVGLVGLFFLADIFQTGSTIWYYVIVISSILITVSVIMFWAAWGGNRPERRR
ncbi:hypothetical protein ACFLXP_01685 [Chloroflexota bacterium]